MRYSGCSGLTEETWLKKLIQQEQGILDRKLTCSSKIKRRLNRKSLGISSAIGKILSEIENVRRDISTIFSN